MTDTDNVKLSLLPTVIFSFKTPCQINPDPLKPIYISRQLRTLIGEQYQELLKITHSFMFTRGNKLLLRIQKNYESSLNSIVEAINKPIKNSGVLCSIFDPDYKRKEVVIVGVSPNETIEDIQYELCMDGHDIKNIVRSTKSSYVIHLYYSSIEQARKQKEQRFVRIGFANYAVINYETHKTKKENPKKPSSNNTDSNSKLIIPNKTLRKTKTQRNHENTSKDVIPTDEINGITSHSINDDNIATTEMVVHDNHVNEYKTSTISIPQNKNTTKITTEIEVNNQSNNKEKDISKSFHTNDWYAHNNRFNSPYLVKKKKPSRTKVETKPPLQQKKE